MDFAQFSLTHQYPGDLGLISLVGNLDVLDWIFLAPKR